MWLGSASGKFAVSFQFKKRDTKLLPVAVLQMTSVGKNHHHNKQPHHMETQSWWCRDRNWGLQQEQRWIEGKTSSSLAMLPKRLRLGGGWWCVCLARHAPFTGASHGKSLWASIPPRVIVYLHNPQATLQRPAQTDKSIPDGGDRETKQSWRSTRWAC